MSELAHVKWNIRSCSVIEMIGGYSAITAYLIMEKQNKVKRYTNLNLNLFIDLSIFITSGLIMIRSPSQFASEPM